MNKSLFLSCSLIVLVVFLAAQADGKKRSFLDRVCKKCDYCKDDPQCDGCKKCVDCVSGDKTVGRHKRWRLQEINKNTFYLSFIYRKGVGFVRKKRTRRPAGRDVTKDAISVKEKTELDWRVARN